MADMDEDAPQRPDEGRDRLEGLIEKVGTNARFNALTRPQALAKVYAKVYAETRGVLRELMPQADHVRVEQVLDTLLDPVLNMLVYDVRAVAALTARVTKLELQKIQLADQHRKVQARLAALEQRP